MSKDPAILFYTSDFITGTLTMSDEQRGKYILLLCLQHQKGYLTESEMVKICGKYDKDIYDKFKQNGEGHFYNERMKIESEKRNKYTESRRSNRNKQTNDSLYIYLIKNNNNGLIKIGSTNDPERRIIELKNKMQEELIIIALSEKTQQKTESLIQKEYEGKRQFNEWFKLTENDIKNIITKYDMNIHMYSHMENENENENINEVNNKKGVFENFRKKYPGTKRGLDTEFEYFKKTNKDWKNILEKLETSIDSQIQIRQNKSLNNEFVPEWKNLKTWIFNKCWEEEIKVSSIEKKIFSYQEAADYARNNGKKLSEMFQKHTLGWIKK